MNKRQAQKQALFLASKVVDGYIGNGGITDWYNEKDAAKVESALNEIAQRLFERSGIEGPAMGDALAALEGE